MALKQDLQKEILNLEAMIIAMGFQSNPKTNIPLNIAKAHYKLLKSDLRLIKLSNLTPNFGLLSIDELVESHLESARAFLNSINKGY